MDRPDQPHVPSDLERAAALETSVQDLERELDRQRALWRDTAAASKALASELKRVRADQARLRGHPAIRLAIAIARPLRSVASAGRRLTGTARRTPPRLEGALGTPAATGGATAAIAPATPASPARVTGPAGDSGVDAFRAAMLATLRRAADDPAARLRVAIAGPAAGLDLGALGWALVAISPVKAGQSASGDQPDVLVVTDPAVDIRAMARSIVTVALIEGDPGPWLGRGWFDEFDVVIVSNDDAATDVRRRSAKVAARRDGPAADAVRDALVGWVSAVRYGIRIGVPDWDVAERWGDYHFARAIQRALERLGHPTRVHLFPAWTADAARRDDVMIHLFGLKQAPTDTGQINVLWQISHPDLASPELYERYDRVFVASDPFAATMAARVTVPVAALHQATDPERFQPDPSGPGHELLFVANSRGVRRRIVDDLAGTTHDLAVYGSRWREELVDPRYVRGESIPNADLARYYSSASIVLNDHWDDMRANGFISNRIYDALACNALVISDHIDGIEAEFDDAVVTYRDRPELEALVSYYLAHPDARASRAARGRAAVSARHTIDRRVRVIVDAAESVLAARAR